MVSGGWQGQSHSLPRRAGTRHGRVGGVNATGHSSFLGRRGGRSCESALFELPALSGQGRASRDRSPHARKVDSTADRLTLTRGSCGAAWSCNAGLPEDSGTHPSAGGSQLCHVVSLVSLPDSSPRAPGRVVESFGGSVGFARSCFGFFGGSRPPVESRFAMSILEPPRGAGG